MQEQKQEGVSEQPLGIPTPGASTEGESTVQPGGAPEGGTTPDTQVVSISPDKEYVYDGRKLKGPDLIQQIYRQHGYTEMRTQRDNLQAEIQKAREREAALVKQIADQQKQQFTTQFLQPQHPIQQQQVQQPYPAQVQPQPAGGETEYPWVETETVPQQPNGPVRQPQSNYPSINPDAVQQMADRLYDQNLSQEQIVAIVNQAFDEKAQAHDKVVQTKSDLDGAMTQVTGMLQERFGATDAEAQQILNGFESGLGRGMLAQQGVDPAVNYAGMVSDIIDGLIPKFVELHLAKEERRRSEEVETAMLDAGASPFKAGEVEELEDLPSGLSAYQQKLELGKRRSKKRYEQTRSVG